MTTENLDSEQLFHKALTTGKVNSQDGKYAIEFIQKHSALRNSSKGTVLKYYFVLKAILIDLQANKVTLETLNEDKTYALFNKIREGSIGRKKKLWSESTRAGYWKVFVLFYRWAAKKYGKQWDQEAKNLIYEGDNSERLIYRLDKKKITKKSIFSAEEVVQLVNTEPNLCYKVFFAILFDSGMRGGEAFSITLKSVVRKQDNNYALHIEQSKTTVRQVFVERGISIGITYLEKWLAIHPHKGLPDKPLFCNTLGEPLNTFAANKQLKKLVHTIAQSETDTEKRKSWLAKTKVSLHSFRHAAATNYANRGLSGELMGKLLGWSEGSQMPATYIRSAQLDAQAALRRAFGVEKIEEKKPEYKICLNCETANSFDREYCDVCRLPVDVKKLEVIKENIAAQKAADAVMQSMVERLWPKLIEDVAEKIKRNSRKTSTHNS